MTEIYYLEAGWMAQHLIMLPTQRLSLQTNIQKFYQNLIKEKITFSSSFSRIIVYLKYLKIILLSDGEASCL